MCIIMLFSLSVSLFKIHLNVKNGPCIKANLFNFIVLCIVIYSARSRVRGTLEIYHAFVRDLDASSSSNTTSESDWDVIDDENVSTTSVIFILFSC